jgi:phage terminase large subunit-like protein
LAGCIHYDRAQKCHNSRSACVDPAATPSVSDKELPVYVGVDASVKHDSTGVAVVAWDKVTKKVHLIRHRIFQPSPTEPLNFEATIEQTVLDLAQRFRVCRVMYDPYQMASSAQRLTAAGIRMEEFPQTTGNLTAASQNLFELIAGKNLIAYPDAAIRLAVSRAVAIESPRGWRITKEKQSHKIDVVVALAMACHAAITIGAIERRPPQAIGVPTLGSSLRYGSSRPIGHDGWRPNRNSPIENNDRCLW